MTWFTIHMLLSLYYNINDLLQFTHNQIIKWTHDLSSFILPFHQVVAPDYRCPRLCGTPPARDRVQSADQARHPPPVRYTSPLPSPRPFLAQRVRWSSSSLPDSCSCWPLGLQPLGLQRLRRIPADWQAVIEETWSVPKDVSVYYNRLCTIYADKITFDNKIS